MNSLTDFSSNVSLGHSELQRWPPEWSLTWKRARKGGLGLGPVLAAQSTFHQVEKALKM